MQSFLSRDILKKCCKLSASLKISKNDIGGVQFIKSDYKNNFIFEASETVYKYIELNVYNDRTQKLPIVKSVDVKSINNTTYKYNDLMDDKAYKVTASWTYDSENDYQNKATFIFVHEDKKLSLVEME